MLDESHCAGCRDDFYNGHNPYGVTECWLRENAVLGEFKLIPIDLAPPYLKIKTQSVPTCYQRPRYVKAKPESLDAQGYWK